MELKDFIKILKDVINRTYNKEDINKQDIYLINNAKSILDIKQAYRDNKYVCFNFNDKIINFENPFRIIEFIKTDNTFIDKVFGKNCKFVFEKFYNKIDKVKTVNDNMLYARNIVNSINKDYYFDCGIVVYNAAFIISCAIILYKRHNSKTKDIIANIKDISPQLYDRVVSISSYATMFDYDEMEERSFIFKA